MSERQDRLLQRLEVFLSQEFIPEEAAEFCEEAVFEEDVFKEPAFWGSAPTAEDVASSDAAPVAMSGAARSAAPVAARAAMPDTGKASMPDTAASSLRDQLEQLDEPFSTTLLHIIDSRGFTDSEIYKRANLSRQHFSKIRSDANYRPSKRTVLALALALELNLQDTEDLLERAGFAFSRSSKADLIVKFFIMQGVHDIMAVNEALFAYDQPLL